MKISGPPHDLQTEAGHNFQRSLVEFGAVGREQDFRIAFGQFQSGDEQFSKSCSTWNGLPRQSAKGGRIKNDHVKLLAFPGQSREDIENIVGQKAMLVHRHSIDRKISRDRAPA